MSNKKKKSGFTKGFTTFLLLLLIILCTGIYFFLQLSDFSKTDPKNPVPKTSETAPESSGPEDSGQTAAPSETLSPEDMSAALDALEAMEENNGTVSLPEYPVSDSRVTYQEGFYYEPVDGNTELMERIRNLSFNESINTKMSFDKLSYVRVKHINFQDQEQEGEIICSKYIAQDLVEIFYDLYNARYQIEQIRLIDDFGADDAASMAANNSSAFNYRLSTGTTGDISEHSWGVCIDINPLYNPYVGTSANGEPIIEPAAGASYADRSQSFPHKIDENDLCYQLFTKHGFTWGGNWTSVKDYQHFQKDID